MVSGQVEHAGAEAPGTGRPAGGKPPRSRVLGEFGARVRACRVHQGLTQEQLGAMAGLHWSFVGQVERGQVNISLQNMVRLAQGLGINLAQLTDHLTAEG